MKKFYSEKYYLWLKEVWEETYEQFNEHLFNDKLEKLIATHHKQSKNSKLDDEELYNKFAPKAQEFIESRFETLVNNDKTWIEVTTALTNEWNEKWNSKAGYNRGVVLDYKDLYYRAWKLTDEQQLEWNMRFNQFLVENLLKEIELMVKHIPGFESVQDVYDLVSETFEIHEDEILVNKLQYSKTIGKFNWEQQENWRRKHPLYEDEE